MATHADVLPLPATVRLSPAVLGGIYGLATVAMWGAYLAFARAGVTSGLTPVDFLLLRYGTAGIVMLPWLLARGLGDLGGVGWGRGAAMAVFAGPLFIALGVGGYVYAPLAHGAVIQPSTITVGAMLATWLIFGERPPLARFAGIAIILAGVTLIATSKSGTPQAGAWRGDLLFVAAGAFWVAFTLLLRHWKVGALQATAAVSVLSAAVVIPGFLLFSSFERLAQTPVHTLLAQVVVQGLLSGVLAVIAYGKTVQHLGPAKAALFPAMVPASAMLFGLIVAGEVPSLAEGIGALLATFGLIVAMGVLGAPGRRRTV